MSCMFRKPILGKQFQVNIEFSRPARCLGSIQALFGTSGWTTFLTVSHHCLLPELSLTPHCPVGLCKGPPFSVPLGTNHPVLLPSCLAQPQLGSGKGSCPALPLLTFIRVAGLVLPAAGLSSMVSTQIPGVLCFPREGSFQPHVRPGIKTQL